MCTHLTKSNGLLLVKFIRPNLYWQIFTDYQSKLQIVYVMQQTLPCASQSSSCALVYVQSLDFLTHVIRVIRQVPHKTQHGYREHKLSAFCVCRAFVTLKSTEREE